jgi:hypothetical protein
LKHVTCFIIFCKPLSNQSLCQTGVAKSKEGETTEIAADQEQEEA